MWYFHLFGCYRLGLPSGGLCGSVSVILCLPGQVVELLVFLDELVFFQLILFDFCGGQPYGLPFPHWI